MHFSVKTPRPREGKQLVARKARAETSNPIPLATKSLSSLFSCINLWGWLVVYPACSRPLCFTCGQMRIKTCGRQWVSLQPEPETPLADPLFPSFSIHPLPVLQSSCSATPLWIVYWAGISFSSEIVHTTPSEHSSSFVVMSLLLLDFSLINVLIFQYSVSSWKFWWCFLLLPVHQSISHRAMHLDHLRYIWSIGTQTFRWSFQCSINIMRYNLDCKYIFM